MEFTKMHGTGNDYVYVDCTENELENPEKVSIFVSDRHFGIGSDGLILIKKSDRADFFMDMYNADGSRGRMCGNGIRCVGKYVYDNKLTDKTVIYIDTLSGIKRLDLTIENGKAVKARVDMGAPILEPEKIPVRIEDFKKSIVVSEPIVIAGTEYKMTCVSMGNPHAVVYVDSTDDLEIEKIGPLFEKNSIFPEQINTEFVQVIDRNNLKMRVWERGSGETLACGTGTCAALVATVLNDLCDTNATVHLLGGELEITWDKNQNTVYMEGPAESVFKGEVDISHI